MKKVDIQEYNALCAQFWGLKHGWWIHQEKPLTDDKKQWCNIGGKNFLDYKYQIINSNKYNQKCQK